MPTRPPRYSARPSAQRPKTLQRASAAARGYGRRWRSAARIFLAEHPLCRACSLQGRTTAATCVDHIVPHRGDQKLFWRRSNWQALCTTCHNQKTARGE